MAFLIACALLGGNRLLPAERVTGRPRGVRRWSLILLCALNLTNGLHSQSVPPTEYQVKAAFLYNFTKFVEWPRETFLSTAAPIQICILGRDDFGLELETITQDKRVDGRSIEINHVYSLGRAENCHILFISSSEHTRIKQVFSSLQGKSILTVGDEPGFARSGGVINFLIENARVKFEVNIDAANQAHLKISSKLLALAKLVHRDRPGGD